MHFRGNSAPRKGEWQNELQGEGLQNDEAEGQGEGGFGGLQKALYLVPDSARGWIRKENI